MNIFHTKGIIWIFTSLDHEPQTFLKWFPVAIFNNQLVISYDFKKSIAMGLSNEVFISLGNWGWVSSAEMAVKFQSYWKNITWRILWPWDYRIFTITGRIHYQHNKAWTKGLPFADDHSWRNTFIKSHKSLFLSFQLARSQQVASHYLNKRFLVPQNAWMCWIGPKVATSLHL